MALAVTVNPPACVPAGKLTRATPFASVSAVPDDGTNAPVLSVVVKVTATSGTAFPLSFFNTACSVPGRSGDTDVMTAPEESINEIVSGLSVRFGDVTA